jgi:hypothetical protein
MTAPSLYLHFRALGRPFLWAAYFSLVLDFVQPLAARGQLIGFGWEARGDEAGRKRTQHGSKHRCAAAKCESSAGF